MPVLKYCRVEQTEYGCITTFEDGETSSNWAPQDYSIGPGHPYEGFVKTANDCGFDNLLEYIFDHDLSHAFLAEKMFNKPSPVLWAAAHGGCPGDASTLYEERYVYHWQRYVNLIIPPMEEEWPLWAYEYKYLRSKDNAK